MHERRPAGGAWGSDQARVGLIFAAMFFVTGISTPYLPMWLESRGLSIAEIGVLSIVPQLVRSVCAPAVGFEADRRHSHRLLIIWLGALGVAAWILLGRANTFGVALMAMSLIALSNTLSPLVESIAMAGVRTSGHDYGRMRLWGSAAFVAASMLGGWQASRYGNGSVIWLLIAGAVAILVAAILLRQPDMTDAGNSKPRRLTYADARALMRVPLMPQLLLAAGAVQGAHGMFYAYGTLHWQAQGIDARWFGALWAVGLVTEIALFWWSKAAVRTWGAAELLLLGAALSVFRWIAMAFDPPLALLAPLQVLHGLTFGASHLGAMHVLARIAPPDRSATAQALYSLVATIGMAIATGLSARIYPTAGGATYLIMAAMSIAALVASEAIRRRLPT